MDGTATAATARLVGTPADVGGRPDAATVTLAREEIEEALASDLPLELILDGRPRRGHPAGCAGRVGAHRPREGARRHG